jgi:hypothetical protein
VKWLAVYCAALAGCALDLDGMADVASLDASAPAPTIDAGGVRDAAPPPPPADASDATATMIDAQPESGAPPVDDSGQPAMPDAGCPGVICNGACTDASTCAGCSAGHARCAATNTCGCGGCKDDAGTAAPVECFVCDANRQNAVGTCQPDDVAKFCLNNDPNNYGGGHHCGCSNSDPSSCPGPNQVCVEYQGIGGLCMTCGEQNAPTDNAACQGGTKCHANDKPPRCK